MNQKINHKQLSKTLSLALRHQPKILNISLDEEGWTPLPDMMKALQNHRTYWKELKVQDLEEMMAEASKQRFQIKNDKIRAVYGHSIQQKIKKEASNPPEILYHGTARKTVSLIQKSGLLPMKRQYVHLSADTETATTVGKRRDNLPVILRVNAQAASQSGIQFYKEENDIWLSEVIPPEFIVFPE